jgi:hypothetical protein
MQLQGDIKRTVTGNFELRITRTGARIVTKGIADFSAIKSFIQNNNLSYFTFFPRYERPIKALILHLPQNTPDENISVDLVSLCFDVISVKQMTATSLTFLDVPYHCA